MKRVVLIGLLCGAVALPGSNLYAACAAADPTPVSHLLAGYLDCDDSGPVQAFAYQLSNPTGVNSGPLNMACASGAGPSLICGGSIPGDIGDRHLTVENDASIVGWNGCPAKFTAAGRMVVVAIDSVGAAVMLSVSGLDPNFGYFLELAHPINATQDGALPLSCGDSNRPRITSLTKSGGNVNAQLRLPLPTVHSDCDAGTLGKVFTDGGGSVACDNFVPTPAQGRIYTSMQPCGLPDVAMARWTPSNVTPDAAGNANFVTPSPVAPNCLFIGGSNTINGSPEFLNGFVSVPPDLAASPRAEEVRVANANGKVKVTWKTSTEIGLGAFKILTRSKGAKGEIEVATVAPKGGGGAASYAETYGLGQFKGGRTVIIRAVMTDGKTLDSAPVDF